MDAQTLTGADILFGAALLRNTGLCFAGTKTKAPIAKAAQESNCQDKDGQPGEETDRNEK